jgi:hypothetical protein
MWTNDALEFTLLNHHMSLDSFDLCLFRAECKNIRQSSFTSKIPRLRKLFTILTFRPRCYSQFRA